jgi:hypothetical protein
VYRASSAIGAAAGATDIVRFDDSRWPPVFKSRDFDDLLMQWNAAVRDY